MWKVSGNGMKKPSYLYGTMHISGKMAFHLGDQFYQAIGQVDVVALELEPEAWLKAIFDDQSSSWYAHAENSWSTEYGFGYEYEAALPALKDHFRIQADVQEKVKNAMIYDPALLNYLLFRYGDYGFEADFEEDTWLDMYIYQTGKKLGKETMGLETYAQSDHFIKLASQAEKRERHYEEYDEKDRKEMMDLQAQFEPAYRRQDLDLIDSLNKRTSSPSFDKYILIERNKVFVHNIDSVLKSGKSMLSGMGCAHLPGNEGVIEILRSLGYIVESYNKGERNARQREKLDRVVYKREYKSYSCPDQVVRFDTPASVFYLGTEKNVAAWISLDIANGSSFLVERIKSYAGLTKRTQESLMQSVDSILYEAVAGVIVSQKKISVGGHPGIDVLNRTRRGDYHRRMIIILPEEILILKLTSTGEKVKLGYGNEFFSSLKYSPVSQGAGTVWTTPDKLLSCNMPGNLIYYEQLLRESANNDFEVSSSDPIAGGFYVIQRHTIDNPNFLDEDHYELNRLADAFQEDNQLTDGRRKPITSIGLPAMEASFVRKNGETVYAKFLIQNLNYYIFSAFGGDSLQAKLFFDAAKFRRVNHEQFYAYEDTIMHLRVKLTYEPIEFQSSDDDEDWYAQEENVIQNTFIGARGNRMYSPPGEPDLVDVSYQRYHKFSDGEDSVRFFFDKEKIVVGNDMKVDKKSIAWNTLGCEMNFLLSDTESSRRMMYKMVLHNKTFYTLKASYDSVLGPGDFISTFFESFQPTDTVFPFFHFSNRDGAFLDVLLYGDSTEKVHAASIISEMDFSAAAGSQLRYAIQHIPDFPKQKDREVVLEKLTAGLSTDTSAANIHFITQSFYANSDSTVYQIELLRVLARMKTQNAFNAYKKLILDDPPILSNRNNTSGFALLSDSLKMATVMLPELMQLLALDEYEDAVYALMSSALDSNFIKSLSYSGQVNQIVMEAKNELKRLNATTESAYKFDTAPLLIYCTLLQPYRSQPEVAAFFEKAYKSRKHELLLDLLEFDLNNKVRVSDTVITNIASKEYLIVPLYVALHEHHLDKRFPAQYRTRELLISAYIKGKFDDKSGKEILIDSILVFHNKKDSVRGDHLDIYYCKYRKIKSKQWIGMIIAFDESDAENLWPRYIERSKTVVLSDKEDHLIEMDNEFKTLIELNRRRRNYNDSHLSNKLKK